MQQSAQTLAMGTPNEWLSHIKLGQRFDIQLLDQFKTRFSSELIGYKGGRYLLLRPDDSVPERFLQPGLVVVCRFILEDAFGECLAFKSELLQLIRMPDKLMAIAFPLDVQRRALRSEKRNSIYLPAMVKVNLDVLHKARQFSGYLIDVSISGCRFLFAAEHNTSKVNLAPVLLNVACKPSGEALSISGEVKNSKLDERGLSIGIQFNEPQLKLENLAQARLA